MRRQNRWQNRLRMASPYLILAIIFILAGFGIYQGYQSRADWTGFYETAAPPTLAPANTPQPGVTPAPTPVPPAEVKVKKLWDWLSLIVVPIVLAVFGIILSQTQKNTDLEIQRAKEQETAYVSFLDKMTELTLNGRLMDSAHGDEVRDLARSRVLVTLETLNEDNKKLVVNYLLDCKLIEMEDNAAAPSPAPAGNRDHSLSIIHMGGANLEGVELDNVLIPKVAIVDANLNHASLSGVKFSEAILSFSTFERAFLNFSKFNFVDMDGAHLKRASLALASLEFVNLIQADAQAVNCFASTFLNVIFRGADLREANFSYAKITDCEFVGADLSGAKFTRATLRSTKFALDAEMKRYNENQRAKGLAEKQTTLRGTDFYKADLAGVDFSDLDLTHCLNLKTANLQNVNFSGANLTGIDLRGAKITGANLNWAKVSQRLIGEKELQVIDGLTNITFV